MLFDVGGIPSVAPNRICFRIWTLSFLFDSTRNLIQFVLRSKLGRCFRFFHFRFQVLSLLHFLNNVSIRFRIICLAWFTGYFRFDGTSSGSDFWLVLLGDECRWIFLGSISMSSGSIWRGFSSELFACTSGASSVSHFFSNLDANFLPLPEEIIRRFERP